MKKTATLAIMLVIAIFTLTLAGCSGGGGSKDDLVGTWTYEENTSDGHNATLRFELKSDKTANVEMIIDGKSILEALGAEDVELKQTWSRSGDMLEITGSSSKDGKTNSQTLKYKIIDLSGNALTLEDESSHAQMIMHRS